LTDRADAEVDFFADLSGQGRFGRFDPGDRKRRGWILAFALACSAIFAGMALGPGAVLDVAAALAIGLLSGFIVWQYADVRSAYPARMTGRAMAVFTMAMFLGVALMQWLTGLAASAAANLRIEPYAAVLGSIAGFLLLGALAFHLLPRPAPAGKAGDDPAQSTA